MQRSIFSKYFSVVIAVVLAAMVFLGVIMLVVASQYFEDERRQTLTRTTEVATASTVDYIERGRQDGDLYYSLYTIMTSAMDVDITLLDNNGTPRVSTNSQFNTNPVESFTISEEILGKIDEGEYFELGTLGGIYRGQYYTVAVPVIISDGTQYGYLIASSPANGMMDFLIQILRMFSISSLIVLFMAFIVVYFLTMQMTRPLKQMAYAAKRIGSGDFSMRIQLQGDDELAQLANELNEMAQSLSTQENVGRSFTANVSHELRTPMTTISGFVDGILDGTIPPEHQREYLTIVSEEVKRLSRLVKSMLNLARIENGNVELKEETFDIVDVILQTLFSFEKQIEAKQVEIVGLDVGKIPITADKDLVHQVVYNLIENAVKFVNDGGTLEFRFHTEQGKTHVAIKNTGAGLSAEDARRIFERFYKSDRSRGLDKGGVGLGLHIVRSIIHLHDGEITVNTKEDEYTEFQFSLPAGKLQKAKKARAAELEKHN